MSKKESFNPRPTVLPNLSHCDLAEVEIHRGGDFLHFLIQNEK